MNRYEKGEYGYFKSYKLGKLFASLILAAMICFAVVTLYLMFKDKYSVMLLIPILLSLPFAKFLIGYIICAKFSPMDEAVYESITAAIPKDFGRIYYDVCITKTEGVKHYSCIVVKNGKIYALVLEKDYKDDKKTYEKWLLDSVSDSKYKYIIKCFDDTAEFLKKINFISEPNDNTRLTDKHIATTLLESSL